MVKNMKKILKVALLLIMAVYLTPTPHKVSASVPKNDQFLNIGSVSKMYVVTAVMQLYDKGKVDLDKPVTKYIPDFKMADARYKDITVRMLMNHTSGLMGSMYGGGFLFDDKSTVYHDEFLTRLSKERLKYVPGEYNCYCNDGFTLLEILVENVSGMSYSDYLTKNVLAPISADNTYTCFTVPDMDKQSPIYINNKVRIKPESVKLLGAGGIMSDSVNVCDFGATFFAGDNKLLSDNAKKEMAKDYAVEEEHFGLGWDEVVSKDYNEKGVTVLKKGGDTNFQHSQLAVAPDEDISVAVLASGGSGSVTEKLAMELLDIGLEEKGKKIHHPEDISPDVTDSVPDEYKDYEGLYANANMVVEITFPDMKYMSMHSLTNNEEFVKQYKYVESGEFVEMSGDVASDNAIVVKPVELVDFVKKNGTVYGSEGSSGFVLEKVTEKDISDKVMASWEERNGRSYYYYSGSANDMFYFLNSNCVTLNTNSKAEGYVNGCTIMDMYNARNMRSIPGSASRDVSDIKITNEGGKEILTFTDQNTKYISEKDIPEYSSDLSEITTTSGEASWYKINGRKNETVKFDIPDNAAVYVYDQFGNIKYSNYMLEYNSGVPLPEYGMIVFVGDTGANVKISR